jgi:hypothetical protein
MIQDRTIDVPRRPGMFLAAGIGAGVVAAVGSVGVQLAAGVRIAPLPEIAWSAFVAGLAGGLLYWVLAHVVRRPIPALWGVSLGIATLDNVLIALLPLPGGHEPHLGIPIDGLVIPLRQMGALAGLGHFGARFFPAAKLPADIIMHYVPAVAVAMLVPWWVGFRGSTRPDPTPNGKHQEPTGSARGESSEPTRPHAA